MTKSILAAFSSQPTKQKKFFVLNLLLMLYKNRLIIHDWEGFSTVHLTTYKSNMAAIRNNKVRFGCKKVQEKSR